MGKNLGEDSLYRRHPMHIAATSSTLESRAQPQKSLVRASSQDDSLRDAVGSGGDWPYKLVSTFRLLGIGAISGLAFRPS